MTEKVVFKKYANRRVYNTEKSAYVTLNEVADIIRQGRQVMVLDVKTKEDVTEFILTQIILEEARKKNALLPVPLLHLVIQFGDNILGEFFGKYLQQIVQSYLSHKSGYDEQFNQWLKLGMNLSEMAQKTATEISPLKSFFDPFFYSPKDKEKNNG